MILEKVSREGHTGNAKWSRCAASFSPTASKATTGAPNVTPMRDASDPPNECPIDGVKVKEKCSVDETDIPITQIFASGYKYVILL